MEAFEKELNDAKIKDPDNDDDEEPESNTIFDDDADLGDIDPFARAADAPVGLDTGTEAWLKSDRDYTYQEVGLTRMKQLHNQHFAASH